MTVPQIIALAIIIFIVVLSFKKGSDLLSPAKVFLSVWAVCIMLVEFKFSGYQHQWSLFGWFVLLLGLSSFLVGIFSSYVINLNKPLVELNVSRKLSLTLNPKSVQNLFYIINILFILYLIAYIAEVLIEGYIPIFSPRIEKARVEFGIFGLHLIVNFQLITMFLAIEYIFIPSVKKFRKVIVWSIFFITLISFALLLQRFNFFMWAIMTLGLLYYASHAIKFKRVIVILLLFFGLLWVIQSIRLSQYVSQYVYVVSKMKFSREYAFFTEPYMYISMNMENMVRAVEKLEHFSYGLMTFDWAYALFGIKHWMTDYFNITPRPFIISGYNTYPFHWYYYYDFGLIGTVILSLLTGFLIGVSYYRMRLTANPKWIALYSIGLGFIVISFFTNPFTMLNFAVSFSLIWLIHHFFIRQQTSPSKNS